MTAPWPRRSIAEVAPLMRRPVRVEAGGTYHEIGIRSFAKGIFHKAPTTGLEIGDKRVFAIKPGDLLFNIVFAWEGAVAVASAAEEGSIGSHRFLTCVPNPQLADARFLFRWFSRGEGREQLLRASPGGAGRNRTLGIDKLAAIEVPLPPLEDQRRIADRLDTVSACLSEASTLRAETIRDTDDLLRAVLNEESAASAVPMSELVRLRTPDVDVEPTTTYHFAGVYSFGRGVFKGVRRQGSQFAYKKLSRLQTGNFTYPKLMAWEGALGTVPPVCNGLVVSPEFPVFEVNEDRVLPEVLDIHFRSPAVWPSLSGASTGTNVRRRRLNPVDFLKYKMALPSMPAQMRARELNERLRPLRELRQEMSEALDAMMPAALAKAFRGEL